MDELSQQNVHPLLRHVLAAFGCGSGIALNIIVQGSRAASHILQSERQYCNDVGLTCADIDSGEGRPAPGKLKGGLPGRPGRAAW